MKKRILPFMLAMSVALPIQSFAAENVEASSKDYNEGKYTIVWQSSNTVFKYKIIKCQPVKYKKISFGYKGRWVIPTTVAPKVEQETKEEPKNEPVTEAKEEPKQKPVVEAKPEVKEETKQEPVVEAKPVTPTEPKQEAAPVESKQEAKPTETTPKETQASADTSISQVEQEVVRLVNVERSKAGLQPLVMDSALSQVAKKKSEDMKAKNYFSHTSPTYGSPFDMMKTFGISYTAAGENIAKGQRSAQEVVNSWMNSAGHRANILSTSYTHIGVGYVESGHYWTQMFIKK